MKMKSTKVLNPRRCIMRVHEKHAWAYTRNTHAVQLHSYQLLDSEHTG
jgi:hypothetical protein